MLQYHWSPCFPWCLYRVWYSPWLPWQHLIGGHGPWRILSVNYIKQHIGKILGHHLRARVSQIFLAATTFHTTWILKRGSSGCMQFMVGSKANRREMIMWLLEDDELATGEELPINAPQLTNPPSVILDQHQHNISAHRSAATTISSSDLPAPRLGSHPITLPNTGEEIRQD